MKTEAQKVVSKSKKEVSKMNTKITMKCLAIALVVLTATFNMLPYAQAIQNLQTPVAITATGTLAGTTVAFSAVVVAQGTGASQTQVDFTSPSGISDSGDALKITGGTNEIGGRIIIYTDNSNYFSTGHDPRLKSDGSGPSGLDGSGLVGQSDAGYVATMLWGIKSGANGDPNTNMDYVFGNPASPVDGSTGNCVYIVDKGHTLTFCPGGVDTGLDNTTLYKLDGTAVTNKPHDGLYPQVWDYDLYNSATVHTEATRVSPALYSSIATIAYSVSPNTTSYVCNVPNLTTYDGVSGSAKSGDSVTANLAKYGTGTTDNYLYVYLGADFTGKPAQVYTTNKLYVAIVKD